MSSDFLKPRRALLSVSDKTSLLELSEGLARHDVDIISTGGTFKQLQEAGIKARDVSSVTGFPEIMDGRVKTLHPKIHGGLLGKRDRAEHVEAMRAHDITGIDLLVVNLYPFESTVASGADDQTCIENIDIGGPAMLRAGAKNFGDVCVLTDIQDYEAYLDMLESEGGTSLDFRRQMAMKAFTHTAQYDTAVSGWFKGADTEDIGSGFTDNIVSRETLRYGENPHQEAEFCRFDKAGSNLANARQVQGKELSYNNILDASAALELVQDLLAFEKPGLAIIKHSNPCGVAIADTQIDAYQAALRCDPVSAFGGIIAMNTPLEEDVAQTMCQSFVEVVIAPDASKAALEICQTKKNMRVLLTGQMTKGVEKGIDIRSVSGGLLIQDKDIRTVFDVALEVVTKTKPSDEQMQDLKLASLIAKHVKSNAIVYVREGAAVGIGAGQMSRIDSARIAASKAQDAAHTAQMDETLTQGSVAASDAFFPFADGLEEIARAGAKAVIQPGGSMRDDDVIKAADDLGLAMVFTGTRHFRH